jgi:hypothetical protein
MVPTLAVFKRLMELLGSDTLTLNPGGRSMIVADFSFVGQGSDIAETTIYTPSAEGVFRLSVYFPSRNALGAGTHVAFNLSYPDNTENWVNYPLLSLDMGSKNIQWACLLFFAASGSPISFNCTADGVIGGGRYDCVGILESME